MRALLEEAHRATMQNERAAAKFGVLCRPPVPAIPAQNGQPAVPAQEGEKLVIYALDSWPILTQKPSNHHNQRATWSTKHHGNSLSRLEACDMEGRPVFTVNLSASTSPRATDESMCFFNLEMEAMVGLQGGLADKLSGLQLPGFCIVLLMDNGFR